MFPVRCTTLAVNSSASSIRCGTTCVRATSPSCVPSGYRRLPPVSSTLSRSFTSDENDARKNRAKRTPRTTLVYEGALASVTLRLKQVSITTCAVGFLLPGLVILYGGDVPAMGRLAVGGTAVAAATGSTALLNYCFSPYVHTLERVMSLDVKVLSETSLDEKNDGAIDRSKSDNVLIRATTRDILARKVETLFDPAKDVDLHCGNRPFCNFVAKGVPMYVHPELISDDVLRVQLLGKKFAQVDITDARSKMREKQDDDFL